MAPHLKLVFMECSVPMPHRLDVTRTGRAEDKVSGDIVALLDFLIYINSLWKIKALSSKDAEEYRLKCHQRPEQNAMNPIREFLFLVSKVIFLSHMSTFFSSLPSLLSRCRTP